MQEYYVIGLMSGTSLDGLDIAYCKFRWDNNRWYYDIIQSETIAYSENWKERLIQSYQQDISDLEAIDTDYGKYLAERTLDFIDKHTIMSLDLIASHGHTVKHQPEEGITVQIGNGKVLSKLLKIPVVYDFRTQDVQLGGQGAPLVPIGDELLFSVHDACLNLGGFSNISLKKDNQRLAFDICPVNIVINEFAQKLGFPYDEGGKLAQSGNVIQELLSQLNALEFYSQNPPKSLGREWVETEVLPLLESYEPKDVLRTFTEHIAHQLNTIYKEYQLQNMLITGGGTYNDFLISLLDIPYQAANSQLIEFKEAMIFAFMGVLRTRNEVNVLASVTGAQKDHSSGKLLQFKP